MAPEKGVKFATWRFVAYTVLILGLAVVYVFAATVGSVVLTRWGSWYETEFYPALDTMTAQVRNEDGQLEYKTFPPFQIEEMRWVSDDLLLVKGTLCKAEDYDFKEVHWFYGMPDGFKMPAKFEPQNKGGTRGVGCQEWENWLLKGARTTPAEHFYADLVYRPPHNLWNVYARIGPYRIPPRDSEGPIVPGKDY